MFYDHVCAAAPNIPKSSLNRRNRTAENVLFDYTAEDNCRLILTPDRGQPLTHLLRPITYYLSADPARELIE